MSFPTPNGYGIIQNPLIISPFVSGMGGGGGIFPGNGFLLMDGTSFLLMDGSFFLLMN